MKRDATLTLLFSVVFSHLLHLFDVIASVEYPDACPVDVTPEGARWTALRLDWHSPHAVDLVAVVEAGAPARVAHVRLHTVFVVVRQLAVDCRTSTGPRFEYSFLCSGLFANTCCTAHEIYTNHDIIIVYCFDIRSCIHLCLYST